MIPKFLSIYSFVIECILILYVSVNIHAQKYGCASIDTHLIISTLSVFCWTHLKPLAWSTSHAVPESEESAIAADSSRMRPLGKAVVPAKPRSLSLISLKTRQRSIYKKMWERYYWWKKSCTSCKIPHFKQCFIYLRRYGFQRSTGSHLPRFHLLQFFIECPESKAYLLRMDTEQQRCWCYEMQSFAAWCHISKVKQSGTTNEKTCRCFVSVFSLFYSFFILPRLWLGPGWELLAALRKMVYAMRSHVQVIDFWLQKIGTSVS